MIKWLMSIFFPQEEEKKRIYLPRDYDGWEVARSGLWTLECRLHFMERLKFLILEDMVTVGKDDPRYTKLYNWLELVEILKTSLTEGGTAPKIQRYLGLEVKAETTEEKSNENSNQQS